MASKNQKMTLTQARQLKASERETTKPLLLAADRDGAKIKNLKRAVIF